MHNDNNSHDTEPAAPWLASVPLEPSHQAQAWVIVHANRAVAPPEGLSAVLRFHADGRGGWIGAAQAANTLWGYIDGEGRWRVPPTLHNARSFSSDGLARFCDGGRWGFVNLAGEVVIPPVFLHAQPFCKGLGAVQVGQNAWRIIDRQGRSTGDEVFHELGAFGTNGLARAALWKSSSQQRTYGFVDCTGRWVIEPRFHAAQPFADAPSTAASLDGERYGLIDARGKWVLAPRYPRIDAFNSDGLAFFDEPNTPEDGHGYLNTRGKVVLRGGRLSPRMACAVAANGDGPGYLGTNGQALPTPRLSYGADFSAERGFAVVRTVAQAPEAAGEPTLAPSAWGLLHPDGRFVPAPEHLLEPLTDGKGWLAEAAPDTPLAPFITRDGQLAYIDGEGAVVWRAHYDGQQVALLDADGTPLWRSGVRENCWPPRPFFNAPLTDHLQEGLHTLDGIVPLALRLLADAQTQQHRLLAASEPVEAQTHLHHSDCAEPRQQEQMECSDGGSASLHLAHSARSVVARRVVRACLNEAHEAPYGFLRTELRHAVDQAQSAMVQRLSARFGPPGHHPQHAEPHRRLGDSTQAWAVPLSDPLQRDRGIPGEQWLTLYQQKSTGGGDAWWALWLTAGPSIDALLLAQRKQLPAPSAPARPDTQSAAKGGIAANAGEGDAAQPRQVLPMGRPSVPGPAHAARPLQHKDRDAFQGVAAGFAGAHVRQAALPAARPRGAPILRGLAGWWRQHPVLALVAHLLLGLAAFAGHALVSVAAWQAEGPWIGAVTFMLVGFSELYWGWHFVFSDPGNPWLGFLAATVAVYVFGWSRLYRRKGRATSGRKGAALRA